MRTRRSLALLVASLLFVTLGSGVAAAQTGDGSGLVSLLEGLIAFLETLVEFLSETGSMGR
jgi:hypothetical protein